jgi:hypothetical protein
MKIAFAAAAVFSACVFTTAAHADYLVWGSFGGIVDDGTYTNSGPVNTSFVPGEPISGNFDFDATTDTFNSFSIGGYTAAPGYTTIYSPPLTATAFAFFGVQNPVPNAAPSDDLEIDFYYENSPFPSTVNIAAFIENPGPYSQDLSGGSPSFFSAYLTNPGGSITQVDGLLTSFAVPEPTSLVITLSALTALGLIRRRID